MGATNGFLKDLDAISPSLFCHCDAAHQRTLTEVEVHH
jgi:hypothetical protein